MRDRLHIHEPGGIPYVLQDLCLPQHRPNFLLHPVLHLRVAAHEMHHPGDGVGGRILARYQHGEDVCEQLLIVQRRLARGLGNQHRLQEVGRMRGELRALRQPLACRGDELADGLADRHHGTVERAVRRQPEVVPVRKWRIDAPVHHRQDLF